MTEDLKKIFVEEIQNKLVNNLKSNVLHDVKESGANLNRLLFHLENKDIAFLTAFQNLKSKKENLLLNKKLSLDIRNAGLSFIRIKGGYSYKDNEQQEIFKEEDSFMIINSDSNLSSEEFFTLMIGLCKKFNQEAILMSLKEKNIFGIFNFEGELLKRMNNSITEKDVQDFFSQIHGHKIKFKDFFESAETNRPNSFISSMLFFGTRNELNSLAKKSS